MKIAVISTREQFDKMTRAREEIAARIEPLRKEMHDIIDGVRPMGFVAGQARIAEISKAIVELNKQLAPIDQTRAKVAKHLPNNRTIYIRN